MSKGIDLGDYKHILWQTNDSSGHFAEKNGTRTDIHGHWLKEFGKSGKELLSLSES